MAKEATDKTKNAIANDQADMENLGGDIRNLVNGGGSGGEDPTKVKEAVASKTPFSKTTKITDDENKEMWVPQGFTVTEGEKINEGVVVKDPEGNEFVWVPVDEIGDMVYCQTHTTANVKYDATKNKLVC